MLALAGAGTLAALAGCSGLFTQPESDSTPTVSEEGPGTETATATATPTPNATATTNATATATPADDGTAIEILGYTIDIRYVDEQDISVADVTFDIENASDRAISRVEFRADLVYRPNTENRSVAVDYVGSAFDDGTLEADEEESLAYGTRYPNDGRTDGSTDPDDFGLRLQLRDLAFA